MKGPHGGCNEDNAEQGDMIVKLVLCYFCSVKSAIVKKLVSTFSFGIKIIISGRVNFEFTWALMKWCTLSLSQGGGGGCGRDVDTNE